MSISTRTAVHFRLTADSIMRSEYLRVTRADVLKLSSVDPNTNIPEDQTGVDLFFHGGDGEDADLSLVASMDELIEEAIRIRSFAQHRLAERQFVKL